MDLDAARKRIAELEAALVWMEGRTRGEYVERCDSAGCPVCDALGGGTLALDELLDIAREEEREACADLCDDVSGWREWYAAFPSIPDSSACANAAGVLADAIRRRGSRCGASITDRSDEHSHHVCGLHAGHDGEHCDGSARWT